MGPMLLLLLLPLLLLAAAALSRTHAPYHPSSSPDDIPPAAADPPLAASTAPRCPTDAPLSSGAATKLLRLPVYNGALAQLGVHTLLSGNIDRRLRPPHLGCKSEHTVALWATLPSAPLDRLGSPATRLATLGAVLPGRPCQDVLNFRGNGPEDARILPLGGGGSALVLYNDYAAAHSGELPFRRTMYVREVGVEGGATARASVGPIVRLEGAGVRPPLGAIEKNWSPFAAGARVFVHRWVDRAGEAVAHELDFHTGQLLRTYTSSNGRLRQIIGGPNHTEISGGTPAVRLNATHFLAVGHTMTMPCALPEVASKGRDAKRTCLRMNQWRAYALFGYVFESEPPFHIVAATPQFRVNPPMGKQKYGQEFGPPPPDVTTPKGVVEGHLGKPQFPAGLIFDASKKLLVLSTGYRDRLTLVSWVKLEYMMRRMSPT